MTDPVPPQLPPPSHPQLAKPKAKSHLGRNVAILMIVFIAVAGVGIVSRAAEERRLKHRTQSNAVQTVAVISAQPGAASEDIVLPGTIQAWHEAVVYARTAGYLKYWNTDIGARVKEGDVLAEIDAPDLDAQFRQAQADLNTAIANNNLAQITAKRYVELRKTDSVSQQQADQAIATAAADEATVQSSKANLDHLQEEEDFKKVVAPFDGTITARNVDVGALINGGNSGSGTGQDMFHIAETDKLRVYVQVPESDSMAIKPDLQAELHLPQYPQRTFTATLAATADALDPTTRTLLIQLQADNADGTLLSGGYTDVHLKIPAPGGTFILPVNALLFRDGMQAGVVTNNHVTLKPVKIGRDYGKTIEITDGISPGDQIVINPPDSLESGQQVEIIQPKDQSAQQDKSKNKQKSSDQSESDKKVEQEYQSKDKAPAAQHAPSNDEPNTTQGQGGQQGQGQQDQSATGSSGGENLGKTPDDQNTK